jgi:voltage-gated potassium channel
MPISQWRDVARHDLATTAVRAIVSVTVLLLLYYVVSVESRAHESVILRLTVALALFVVVLTAEVWAISKHRHPMLRAGIAMATVIPLFLVVFAWTYLTLSHSDPAAFGSPLTRTDCLYFTVTVFSTVGFGDITAKTQAARLVVTVQMLADLAVLAVVVRLILGVATREVGRRTTPDR